MYYPSEMSGSLFYAMKVTVWYYLEKYFQKEVREIEMKVV
jgi:hypothetical protein